MSGPGLERGPRPPRPRALLCPQCGAPITLRASGSTVSAVCPACASVLDVDGDETLRLVAAAQARTRTPSIPVGTRGVLDGTAWEVVGYQVRSVQAGAFPWEEFLLFNPYAGFRFLLQDAGAWSLYMLLRRDFADGAPRGYVAGEVNTARTDYVLGEFYWRVRVGDEGEVREYVGGAGTLSEERTGDERTWSEGHALDVGVVRQAFGLAGLEGRAVAAPRRMWPAAVAACAALLLLAAVPFGQERDRTILDTSFKVADPAPHVVSEVDVPGRGGTLAMTVWSPFTGAAATGQVKLLPEARPGLVAPAGYTVAVQFGGGFGDSSSAQSVTFANVPGGRYRVVAEIDTPDFRAGPKRDEVDDYYAALLKPYGVAPPRPAPKDPATVPVTVMLQRHPPSTGTLVAILGALLLWPVMARLVARARGDT